MNRAALVRGEVTSPFKANVAAGFVLEAGLVTLPAAEQDPSARGRRLMEDLTSQLDAMSLPEKLAAGGITIVWCDLDEWSPLNSDGQCRLTADERDSLARLRVEPVRSRRTTARMLLRVVLSVVTTVDPIRIVLGQEAQGRPALLWPDNLPLDFSVSHAGPVAAIALACGQRIGIDVELESAVRNVPSVRSMCRAALSTQPTDVRLADAWTREEAVRKGIGCGWSGHLPHETPTDTPLPIADWQVSTIPVPWPGFTAAVAVQRLHTSGSSTNTSSPSTETGNDC